MVFVIVLLSSWSQNGEDNTPVHWFRITTVHSNRTLRCSPGGKRSQGTPQKIARNTHNVTSSGIIRLVEKQKEKTPRALRGV